MEEDQIRILVIEDEKPIADILEYGFKKEQFMVKSAYTGADGLKAADDLAPHLVILDWMLPDLSGVDVCRMLTELYNIPIIMLTARGSIDDKVYGLESGADDYITKPFDLREVIVRAKTILRRFGKAVREPEGECEIHAKDLLISVRERTVCRCGVYVELTPKEFDLLVWLLKNPRQVFTRTHLLDEIWGYDFMGDTRTVDIHIQRLRKKLYMGRSIITVFGVGYKYVPEE
ncbi:hypothetical protein C817_01866 [Dorea sp. 5-2]|nr:hypothetical protein C817_01866 [Dorea sp. 5-2]